MVRAALPRQAFNRERLFGDTLVNMYPREHPNTPERLILDTTPGQIDFITGLEAPIRGLFFEKGAINSRFWIVGGDTVYYANRLGSTTTATGNVTGGTGPVRMANNVNQLVIVTDPEAFVLQGSTVTKITDADFPSVIDVAYLNGYFVFPVKNSGEYVWSAIDDATSFDALDFATAEAFADKNVGVVADRQQLYFFGERSIEIHGGTGNADAPFQRRQPGVIRTGCLSRDSIVQIDNTIYFLSSNKTIDRLVGPDAPQVVSNGQIEEIINTLTEAEFSKVVGWGMVWEGHPWVVFEFPDKGTFAFDIRTSVWHERRTWEKDNYRVRTYSDAYDGHYVGDRDLGAVYQLDKDTFTEGTLPIEREVTFFTPTERRRTKAKKIILDCTVGDGITTGQGSDPQVMFSKSQDGGRSFRGEIQRSIGKIGEHEKPVIVRRQGDFDPPGLLTKWRLTDPVPWNVYGQRIE